MGLFGFLKRGRAGSKGETLSFAPSFMILDVAMRMASPFIVDKVPQWDLRNANLMLTLGYVFGHIDAAYQMTNPTTYSEAHVAKIFNARLVKYCANIPGVEIHIPDRGGYDLNIGSDIAGLQVDPHFIAGTMAGGNDFVNFVNEKRPPFTLAKLLQASAS